jgi:hypothetical protein
MSKTITAVAFLLQSPLSERDYKRIGIEFLQQRGITISIVDLSHMIFPEIAGDRPPAFSPPGLTPPTVVRTRQEWAAAAAKLDAVDLIVCEIGSGYCRIRDYFVFRAIAKTKTPYLSLLCNSVPTWDLKAKQAGWWERLSVSLKGFRILDSAFRRLPLRLVGLRPLDYAVYGGRASKAGQPLVTEHTHEIWAHSMDFDATLSERSCAGDDGMPAHKTAVFVDQGLGFHVDFIASGQGHIVDVDVFYPKLGQLFERIERELGLEVVIAAHPRSDTAVLKRLLPGRNIVPGATRQLIRDSSLVVMTFSTAVSWATLYHKPVLFFTANSIEAAAKMRGEAALFARTLDRPTWSLDAPDAIDLTDALVVDATSYDAYFRRYIKANDDERMLWQIIFGEIGAEPLPA